MNRSATHKLFLTSNNHLEGSGDNNPDNYTLPKFGKENENKDDNNANSNNSGSGTNKKAHYKRGSKMCYTFC